MKKKLWLSAALLAGLPALAQAQWGISDIYDYPGPYALYNEYLTLGTDGNIYLVNDHGGNSTFGQLIKLSLSWSGDVVTSTSSVLHNFGDTLYGSAPLAPVVEDANGNFFGTANSGPDTSYRGLVYEYSASGAMSTIYKFTGGPTNGVSPDFMTLVQGTADTVILYGAAGGCVTNNSGAIFKLKGLPGTPASWQITFLHEFTGSSTDGGYPYNALLLASDGNLYGTTSGGGTYGDGGIFSIGTAGGTVNHIYFFSGAQSGGGLVERAAGDTITLVGEQTGAIGSYTYGDVYKIVKVGSGSFTYSVLHSFGTGTSNGEYPQGNLIYSLVLGYFFGITNEGGASGEGTFYSLTPSGTFSVLNGFSDKPISTLIWGPVTCEPCMATVFANGGAHSDGEVVIGIQP